MKGHILHMDHATGEGVIRAVDGQRYDVSADDLLGDGRIVRLGDPVDFEVLSGRAVRVYPDPVAPGARAVPGDRNRLAAALLAFFAGGFGLHKFYLGRNTAGFVMLACSLLGWILLFIPTGIVWLIAIIESVIYLMRSDQQFYETYERDGKSWF